MCFQPAVGYRVEDFGSGYEGARIVEQVVVETAAVAAVAEAVVVAVVVVEAVVDVVVEPAAVESPRRIKVRQRSKPERILMILT